MMKSKIDLTDEKKAAGSRNNTAVVSYTFLCLILGVAYLIEVLKGSRSVGSYLAIVVMAFVPMLAAIGVYIKTRESRAVRYIIACGFFVLYTYIMFTTTTSLSFTYIIIVFVMLTVYVDMKLSISFSAAAILINVIVIASKAASVGMTTQDVAEAEIIIACLLLSGIFTLLAVNKIAWINDANIEKAQNEKKQTVKLLNTILHVAEDMVANIDDATKETESLKESIAITKSSMEELAAGTNEAVIAIQTQHNNTEEINRHIGLVEGVTDTIMKDVELANKCLIDGQETMDKLILQVKVSQDASKLVADYMKELREYADRMQGIMSLISNVASQTGLLALNASIEAARAGEAGRGFAVVASEISNLAGQTSNATGDINSLIGNISKSLTAVADSVDGLLSSNQMQNTYVSDTAESFIQIKDSTQNIIGEANRLKTEVNSVSQANALIIQSIENVSAVTEEVTADAGETLEGSKVNLKSIDHVSHIMEKLSAHAQELKKSQESAN